MLKKERRNYILARVRRDGRITTKELVEELGLAEDTIRKDFQDLSAKGLVQRVHGGVLRLEEETDQADAQSAAKILQEIHALQAAATGRESREKHVDFYERVTRHPGVKKKLAARAAQLVSDIHVLYIDG